MPLSAKKAEPVNKRLKLFLFGSPGVGKTKACIAFPEAYIIDCERGCDHYSQAINNADSVLLQTTNADDVIEEVRSLGTEKHNYRTLVIDPITTLEADLIEKAEKEFGAGDMRIWGKRDRTMRRLFNLLVGLDMNVIVTAHGKVEYGDKMVKLGTTFDGWKRLPYIFDLSLELERRGARRVANVRKTRLEGFPDAETFDFSYAEVSKRYGTEIVERAAVPVERASAEQTAQLKALIDTVKLEEGTVDGWLKKNNVEALEDLPAASTAKIIKHIQDKIAKTTGKAE